LTTITPSRRRPVDQEMAEINAAFRARVRAELAEVSPEEHQRRWSEWEARHQRQTRAHEAMLRQAQTPLPARRATAQPPKQTILWSKPVSIDPLADNRLSPLARCALVVLRSLVEVGDVIRKADIAPRLGVSLRQAQRVLAELRRVGLITTRIATNRIGAHIGQIIELAEQVLPAFLRRRKPAPQPTEQPKNGSFRGETAPSPLQWEPVNKGLQESMKQTGDFLAAVLARIRTPQSG
jgi:hypothetical protein